ncbi:TPM domain-containing protein [Paenibacillus ginsengarvi]|nr:TPM domain-containing protein [Paenibacillus ginsengarvi]
MKKSSAMIRLFIVLAVLLAAAFGANSAMAAKESKQLIYDDAKLLSPEQYGELNAMANRLGAKRETDIIIVTSKNDGNVDVIKMTQDFYDEHALGYDKPHGNAVILMMDMKNREVYLAGFYKAKELLDDARLKKIRTRISPDLTSGDYQLAFKTYIQTAYDYMGYRAGVNPDNLLFNIWFQLIVSLVIGGVIVWIMVRNSGGRITINRQTYEDSRTSGVLERHDQYLNTTITKQKIEKNNGRGSGGGGGGGGTTGGGHSHSGSRGSF